jgi:predicted nucleic acid-binding protein
MRFVDTNIILRYLTRDDETKAAACLALFQKANRGEEELTTSEAVITESVYVLASRAHYKLSPGAIRDRLTPILALRGLRISHKRVYLRALDLYALHPSLDFEDVLSAAHMESQGIREILSYDTHFDRIPGVQRTEP